ncbi:hypothetical protein EUGRSUZ_E04231 [Eucalyptus grandis]|uniref:Uncharacterized protein n=2 Tax=Eucalyptus grandis TaxID=71139 RepID=A0ACC3L158_EUCGR|nr:hypothetical protein EUGRSUZ_E04231 [Eucalyptus grandis]
MQYPILIDTKHVKEGELANQKRFPVIVVSSSSSSSFSIFTLYCPHSPPPPPPPPPPLPLFLLLVRRGSPAVRGASGGPVRSGPAAGGWVGLAFFRFRVDVPEADPAPRGAHRPPRRLRRRRRRRRRRARAPGGPVPRADLRSQAPAPLDDRSPRALRRRRPQLGGAGKATPKAIMRTMNVKGLTLFHLKSHLQKYRLGKQSGKEGADAPKDGSYLLENPGSGNSTPSLPSSDLNENYEVKEALRAQMEMQSKLHLQVEAEKHLQIRQEAERRYMAMLERACKMLADQFITSAIIDNENQKCQAYGVRMPRNPSIDPFGFYTHEVAAVHGTEDDLPPSLHSQRGDCSTESCLTSHESPRILALEESPAGGKKRPMGIDSTSAPLIWSEAKLKIQDVAVPQVSPHGLTGFGM